MLNVTKKRTLLVSLLLLSSMIITAQNTDSDLWSAPTHWEGK